MSWQNVFSALLLSLNLPIAGQSVEAPVLISLRQLNVLKAHVATYYESWGYLCLVLGALLFLARFVQVSHGSSIDVDVRQFKV